MECKAFSAPILDLDEPQGIVVAYANVYNNEDSDGDISMPGCFSKTVSEGMKRLRVLKDHNSRESLGVPKEVDTTDSYGLKTTTQFNMKKQLALDMYSDIVLAKSNGQNAELSIGYGKTIRDSKDNRKINEYGWLGEYSFLSSWAANPLAMVTDIKSLSNNYWIDLLTKMYNLPHSDIRLIQVENILKSLTKEPSQDTCKTCGAICDSAFCPTCGADQMDTLKAKPTMFDLGLKKSSFTLNF